MSMTSQGFGAGVSGLRSPTLSPWFAKALVLVAAAFTLSGVELMAQAVPASDPVLDVRAIVRQGTVILRWAPSTPQAWGTGMLGGFQVERATVAPGAQPAGGAYQVIGTAAAWDVTQWEARFDLTTTNDNLRATAATLFGPGFAPADGSDNLSPEEQAEDVAGRFTFGLMLADLDSLSADAQGLRYVDSSAAPGTEYVYRVSVGDVPAEYQSVAVDVTPGEVRINTGTAGVLLQPPGLVVIVGDGELTLNWDPAAEGDQYIAYDVERSNEGSTATEALNDLPLVFTNDTVGAPILRVFTDSTAINYQPYRYRVYGRTPFGERSPAAEVVGMARDLTPPPAPEFTDGRAVDDSAAQLTWTLEEEIPDDFEGFLIGRSSSEEGPFEFDDQTLLGAEARSITTDLDLASLNYFVVAARDTAGNVASSLPWYVHVIDSIAPGAPTGVGYTVDTLGAVSLSWDQSPEPDIYGYRLYKANDVEHEFTLVTGEPVETNQFVDSVEVNRIDRALFYEVTALDQNQNASPPTRIEVVLPDVVAPDAPVITTVTPSDSTISLEWARSASADVSFQLLLRMTDEDAEWTEYATLAATADVYVDSSVDQRRVYYYAVEAVDSAGRRAVSDPVQGRAFDTGQRDGIVGLTSDVDVEQGTTRLSWTYPNPADGEFWFVVYRGIGGGDLTQYRSAGSNTEFVDDELSDRSETDYRYAIRVMYADGGFSEISAPIQVRFPR